MRRRLVIGAGLTLLLLMIVYPVGLALVALNSPTPNTVGLGTLRRCPDTPNCVSSLPGESSARFILPLYYTDEQFIAEELLEDAILSLPRTQIMVEQGGYIHAESRSLVWRFVDDIEFQFDDANKEIHVRSASRLGTSDLGVNRRRVERIRQAFYAQLR